MRRRERELKDKETMSAILERTPVGRMATINREGIPIIKPVNFVYWDKKIFIHSSMKGEKVEDIVRGSPVCFEMDEPIAYVTTQGPACSSSYYYRSVIIKGKATLINDRNYKREILEKLMEKYQPEGGYEGISDEILNKTGVIEISIDKITGKENLG